tara:strand:- start:7397 stop:7684 length:288 start_codon:yes stop_codon:yes gene_type:complete
LAKKQDDGLQKRKDDYKTVFSSDAGNRVLADLMVQFHVGRSSHMSGDSHETAFREGERHAVLHVLDMMGKRSEPSWLNDKLDQGEIEYSVIQEFS